MPYFFHQREVDVLHVGVVVGEGSVIFLKFVDVLGVAEREARFGCRLVNKFVLERESVDVADHLADPSAGDFVAEYVGRYFFRLLWRRPRCRRLWLPPRGSG